MLVRNPSLSQTDQGILYVKGPFADIISYLQMGQEVLHSLEKVEAVMTANGQYAYLVAKRYLSPEEYKQFREKCKNSHTYFNSQKEFIGKLFKEYLANMQPIAMIGLEQQYHIGAKRVINKLQAAGITPWFATRRNLDYSLRIGRSLGVYNTERAIILNGDEPDVVKQDIRKQLNRIQTLYEGEKRKQMQDRVQDRLHTFNLELTKFILRESRKNTIVVSGQTLDLIVRDSYSRDNFAFIVAMSGGLIAYNASPENKKSLVRLVKEKFVEKPQVLAIGNSYSDVQMMNCADVGICVTNKRTRNIPTADLMVSDIQDLDELLIRYGMRFSQQLDSTIYHLYYRSIIFILPQFYFNWYASNTGTSIYSSLLIFLYNFLFTLLPVLTLSSDQPFSAANVKTFPALYVEGKSKKQYLTRKFVLRAALEGFLHSVVLFYISVYTIERTITRDGQPATLGLATLGIYLPVQIVANFKVSRIYYPGLIND